jgi:hypothetical protein
VTRDHETGWRFAIPAAVAYLAFIVLMHAHHELWRDEVHPWSLAETADGFWDIVTGDRVYDGHPPLWYWYLRLWSFATRRIWGLQLAHVVAMTGAALLFLRYGPFPRPLKLLLLASYTLGYEYGTLARNYTLTWVLVVMVCCCVHPLRTRLLTASFLLALMALTSVFGVFIACGMAIMILPCALGGNLRPDPAGHLDLRIDRRLVAGAVMLMAALLFFVKSTAPPDPNINAPDWHFDGAFSELSLRMSVQRVVQALLPVRGLDQPGFWNDIGHFWDEHPTLIFRTGLGVLAVAVLALLPGWFVPAGFLVGMVLISMFMIVRYGGYMRHLGNIFLLLLAANWIHRAMEPRRRHALSTLLLAVIGAFQLQSLVAATKLDWRYAFSGGKAMARRIEQAGLQDMPIVAGQDAIVLTVTGYLGRTFISSQTEEINQTQAFHARRRGFTTEGLIATAVRELHAQHRPILVISDHALPTPSPSDRAKLTKLGFDPSDMIDESFWLYRLDE